MKKRSFVKTVLTYIVISAMSPLHAGAQSSHEAYAADLLVAGAMERIRHEVIYDGSYRRIDYPGGDVPDHIGVCTDVVIRAYRRSGIDLQKEIHVDMTANFSEYPQKWSLTKPDSNIDHRRVPNLRTFFRRKGAGLAITNNPDDYLPGDIVTWVIPGNLGHIGIVVKQQSEDGIRPLVVHNIGQGPRLEDILFAFPITGHYRYFGQGD
jgi:uncharacterized protein YijF (DUF1287 family)